MCPLRNHSFCVLSSEQHEVTPSEVYHVGPGQVSEFYQQAAHHSIAAGSARVTADAIENDGLEAAIGAMSATSPAWLAAELSRSWRALADRDLVGQLRITAACDAPEPGEIAGLTVPLAVVGAPDDPLHPIGVARAWADAAPQAALEECPLTEWGPEPARLGQAMAAAWRRLSA